jgi:hypothetical protein
MTLAATESQEPTVRLGLLMESVQQQQALVDSALERLREQIGGLDAVVRDELRQTLLEELQQLHREAELASTALRQLRATVVRKHTLWGVLAALPGMAGIYAVATYLLPSPAQLAGLEQQRARLQANLVQLTRQGGRVELRTCGSAQRLCVRVDRAAARYGENGEFLVLKGY